jgi:hypothetical protein
MLNANKLALQAARKLCNIYRNQNKRLYNEYCEAYAKIKTAISNEFHLSYTYNNNDTSLTLYFEDSNENEISIIFREYTEKRVAEVFSTAYKCAKNINYLCF